jgi:hypothetical protein
MSGSLYAPCGHIKRIEMIGANCRDVGRFTRAWVSRAAGKERPRKEHHALLNFCRADDVAG